MHVCTYIRFMKYRTQKFSENVVMAYIELYSNIKYSTSWTNYSMLKSTFAIIHDADLFKFQKLRALLKS